MKMKKFVALLLMACMVLSVAACGGGSDKSTATDVAGTESGAKTDGAGNYIAVCLASEPDSIDPALNSAVDGGTMISHLFAGLAKWDLDSEGKTVIKPDQVEELVEPVANEDGTFTYTYTLRDGLKWSDGQPLTAKDYVYSWNRAASPKLAADYNYMFDLIVGYKEMWDIDDKGDDDPDNDEPRNPDAKLAVEAVDDKTIKVTTTNSAAYWNELLAFPTYFPVREDVVGDEAWATNPETYIGNGAYKLTGWEHNSVITLEKNPEFVDADEITMDKIDFFLSDDENNMLTNYQNGDWQMIDNVPTNEIATLKATYPDELVIAGQLGTYYINFNVNKSLLPADSTLTGVDAEKADADIRKGLALLLDRTHIVDQVAQGGQIPASSFVAMGLTEPDGSQFYENAGPSKDYNGYFDVRPESFEASYKEGIELLKKYYNYDEASGKFTNVPSIVYLYNTNEGHKAIAEYVQGALAAVGIDISLENQEWNTFLNTRKNGDFTMARNGWLADYNDPISFLDMWTTVSGNNDIQLGKGAHKDLAMYSVDTTDIGGDLKVENGTWAETYDALIAAIKLEKDPVVRYKMMHKAEDLLMSTAGIMPIYYYTDLYMLSPSVSGFYTTPLGFKFFKYCQVK